MSLQYASLVCHPGTPSKAVRAIDVSVGARSNGTLAFDFRLDGDLAGVRVPASSTPCQADGLWRHTCFEAFVVADDSPAYWEFNFSPSGKWAIYQFRGYRDSTPVKWNGAPRIVVTTAHSSLKLQATVPLDVLAVPLRGVLNLGLSAVIEEEAGVLTYWALRHPSGRPDFHHPDAFTLQLPLQCNVRRKE